jgi:hypothetical protein
MKGIFNILELDRRERMNAETLHTASVTTLFTRPITNRSLPSKLVESPGCGDILSCGTNVRNTRSLFEDQQRDGATLYQVKNPSGKESVSVLSLEHLEGNS